MWIMPYADLSPIITCGFLARANDWAIMSIPPTITTDERKKNRSIKPFETQPIDNFPPAPQMLCSHHSPIHNTFTGKHSVFECQFISNPQSLPTHTPYLIFKVAHKHTLTFFTFSQLGCSFTHQEVLLQMKKSQLWESHTKQHGKESNIGFRKRVLYNFKKNHIKTIWMAPPKATSCYIS